MPSGAKRRKAAKKKKEKGGGGGPNNPSSINNNNTNYPSPQGEDDSKSQDDRESDTGSPFSQENNDREHPFDEENVASERTDMPSVASDLTGSQLSIVEDPAGGNIVLEDGESLVEVEQEVNILSSDAVDGFVASERKQDEDPSHALPSEASSGIEEKALHSLAEAASHILEVGKEVEDDSTGLMVESVSTEIAGFEQVAPLVEVDESLKSSADDGDEEKGIEDAYAGRSGAVSLDIEEKDANSSFAEDSAQILLAERSAEDANGDADVNFVSKVDLETPVVPMSGMENTVIGSVDNEVLEVVEWRLSDNEEKELEEPSKVNGTSPTVRGLDRKEGKVFPLEEDNVETSLDEDKTLTSANEEGDNVFPLADESGKSSSDGVDAAIANEDEVLTVTNEKEDEPIHVRDVMIESSTVVASATETPDTGSVDNVNSVEASDIAVKGIEGTLMRLSDSATEKAGINQDNRKDSSVSAGINQDNRKDSSVSAGTQPLVARRSGLWAIILSCCGLSEVSGISNR